MEDVKYIIYRVYDEKERYEYSERFVYFGWSNDKNVVKAFLSQRDRKKYKVIKPDKEYINRVFSEYDLDQETMIDVIKLRSVKTREDVTIFSTQREIHNYELMVQRVMRSLCSLSGVKNKDKLVELFINLKDKYRSMLELIGFRPMEIDVLFPPASDDDEYSKLLITEKEIDIAYDGALTFPQEHDPEGLKLEGLGAISDVSSKIFYSLESFVRVLKDDL